MRKLFTFLTAVLLTASVFAQSPEKMSYQAVICDLSNNLVTSTAVGMQISILQGSASGTAVYVETQTPTSNANGLISLEIGSGTVVSGTFATIDWANGPYFIKTETDIEGGTSYTIIGTSQLLSVPYALHAKTAETVTGGITETDPTFTSSQAANITATDITNLSNLSGVNTGDQDLSTLATKTALGDSTAQVRSEIPDVSGFLTSYTETDPTFTSSQAANITATDITNLGNLSGVNTGDQDISGIATNTQAIQDTASQIRADIPTVTTYSVGDFAQGGVVFYVDQTGQHGLVCAIEDQDGGSGIRWYNGSYTDTEAQGDGVFAGEMNTMLIIANQGSDANTYAAGVCANYIATQNGVTYGDWYLPSKYELNLMYTNKSTIDASATANSGSGFASAYYWSSTENDYVDAWYQNFVSGSQYDSSKGNTFRVRAVRAF